MKSRERVANHGEVFPAQREVNAMLDLVKQETERIDSRFLEPACGDGNFLAEILRRKLAAVRQRYRRSAADCEKYAVVALTSIYGVDILQDNVEACRQRLFGIWDAFYAENSGRECRAECREAARFLLSRNILCGNALTLMQVDDLQQDTKYPIVFSEWTFPFNDAIMHRKDYTMAELLAASEETDHIKQTGQMSLFANADGEVEPTFLKEYIAHYRRLNDRV